MRRIMHRVLLAAAVLAVPAVTLAAGKVVEVACSCCPCCPPCCL